MSRGPQLARVTMHPTYLLIEPKEFETAYWNRYYRFDLANCAIPVLYFGKTLTTWFSPALLSIYATVMVIKLAQAYLLLCNPAAHLQWRKTILWTERTLRTLISVRLVAYSPSYQAWLGRAPFMRTVRVLLLNSGFTIAYWNIFCLPLDFPSQVMLTAAFVLSSLSGAFKDVHRALDGMLAGAPLLVQLHELLLAGTAKAASLLLAAAAHGSWAGAPFPAAALAPHACGAEYGGGVCDATDGGGGGGGGGGLAAYDGATVATAVISCCYNLYVCGVAPLWLSYHMERVHKQRWLLAHPSVAWANPPAADGKAGRWPTPREAAAQLGLLLLLSLVTSEVIIQLWVWLDVPM